LNDMSKPSKDDLFTLLITQLSSGVWVQLGKLPDPGTGKIERNLDAASMTIDILDALYEKTTGNLTEEQDKFIGGTLAQLKLNYVEELKKPDEPAKPEAESKDVKEPETEEPTKEA